MLEKDKRNLRASRNFLSEDALDALLDKKRLYKTNPSAKELRDEIEAMVSASKESYKRKGVCYALLRCWNRRKQKGLWKTYRKWWES